MIDVIRYPLITKKTSTPTNPPLRLKISKWKKTTNKTEIALKNSISYLILWLLEFNINYYSSLNFSLLTASWSIPRYL